MELPGGADRHEEAGRFAAIRRYGPDLRCKDLGHAPGVVVIDRKFADGRLLLETSRAAMTLWAHAWLWLELRHRPRRARVSRGGQHRHRQHGLTANALGALCDVAKPLPHARRRTAIEMARAVVDQLQVPL